jgi:hypothetical protein
MASLLRRVAVGSRSRTELVGVACQVGLGLALVALAVTGSWLSSSTGFISVFGGGLALWLATNWWWRTGGRPALILVDLWFAAYGSLLMGTGQQVVSQDDGLTFERVRIYLALLGGPQVFAGVAWFVFGLIGAVAVWRSRR